MGLLNRNKKEGSSSKQIPKVESKPTLNTPQNTKSEIKGINLDDKNKKALQNLNEVKPDVINEKSLSSLNPREDIPKKDLPKLAKKLYKYWVIIMKNNRKISSFGVNEEEYAGVKLLIKRIEQQGQSKVVFRELYPEPSFDLNTIKNNSTKLRKDLNTFKQIEKVLVENLFDNEPVEYNYDIADVRLKIQELELMLNSIRYGVTFEYFNDIREDGIPVLIYDLENSGLKLRKFVKEKHTYTEASESKKIESNEARKQIDLALQKRNERDWFKLAIMFGYLILLGLGIYGVFELYSYNSDRAFTDTKQQFEKLTTKQIQDMDKLFNTIETNYEKDEEWEKNILENQEKLIQYILDREAEGIAQR